LTEELSFRSCVVAASFLGGWSQRKLVFVTPLWFGLGASRPLQYEPRSPS